MLMRQNVPLFIFQLFSLLIIFFEVKPSGIALPFNHSFLKLKSGKNCGLRSLLCSLGGSSTDESTDSGEGLEDSSLSLRDGLLISPAHSGPGPSLLVGSDFDIPYGSGTPISDSDGAAGAPALPRKTKSRSSSSGGIDGAAGAPTLPRKTKSRSSSSGGIDGAAGAPTLPRKTKSRSSSSGGSGILSIGSGSSGIPGSGGDSRAPPFPTTGAGGLGSVSISVSQSGGGSIRFPDDAGDGNFIFQTTGAGGSGSVSIRVSQSGGGSVRFPDINDGGPQFPEKIKAVNSGSGSGGTSPLPTRGEPLSSGSTKDPCGPTSRPPLPPGALALVLERGISRSSRRSKRVSRRNNNGSMSSTSYNN